MSNTQLISAGDSAASRSAEPGSPLDRVSHDRKAQEGAERALSSESEDEGATSAPELGKTYAFAVKRSLTPVRELPESSPAAPSSPAKSADLQQENAATTSEEAQGEEAHWEIASTRSARRKARKEGSVSGTSSGGSSSEGESDLNSRRRRGASRHVPIYRRVSFNVPTPETVRGQSVRDDLEAVTHPLKSRREHTPSVLVTPDKVLYGNKEQARLKLLSDEVNGHPAPSPARSDWLFEQIAEIASARRRQRAQPGSKREDFSAVREIEHLRAEKESIYNELLFQRTQVQQANDEIDRLKDLLNEAPSTEAFNIYRTYCRVHMGTSQLRTLDNAGFNTASQAVILSGLVGEGLEIVP
ncbi:hypothetical protein JCM1841_002672 [Sporobolomyces salmonicolor]